MSAISGAEVEEAIIAYGKGESTRAQVLEIVRIALAAARGTSPEQPEEDR